MKEKFYLVVFCILLFACPLRAQSFEEYRKKAADSFNSYREQKVSEFREYRERKNAEFEEYLRKAWQEMPEFPPKPKPENDDDDIKPVVAPDDLDKDAKDNPIIPGIIIDEPTPEPSPEPIAPIEEDLSTTEKWLEFSLYGTSCRVRFDLAGKPRMKDGSENSVADMWHTLCTKPYDNLYYDCLSIKRELDLCDWAYIKMTEVIAKKAYGETNNRESAVLQSTILLQSGFKLIMGRSDDSAIHILLSSDCDMYGYPYFEVDGDHFYLIDGSQTEKLYFMTQIPEELKQMRLSVVAGNHFTPKRSPLRTLSSRRFADATASVCSNVNLIAFYNEYPESYVNNDSKTRWRFYAQAPLSETSKSSLYPPLKKAISGKSELQATNILLNFVQTAFVYEYDDKIWGRDRAFFSDESLYYPYCDCEDRAILFSRMVRDLIGLRVALVYYPGHLATAVRFNEDVTGDYLMVKGKKYVVCDPTIIGAGAPVGVTMEGMDNGEAVVIEL